MESNWLAKFENNFKTSMEYELSVPMKELTTLKIGGIADVYAKPSSVDELKELLKFCRLNEVPCFLIGRGSNLLVRDGGFRGVVYSLRHPLFTQISLQSGELISVGGGAVLSKLTRYAADNDLSGFEFLSGIPGSVGGALFMNAGAYKKEIFDLLVSVEVLSENGEIKSISAKDIEHSYRTCPFFAKNIVILAVFKGVRGAREKILQITGELQQKRKSSQPPFPSAGCTFKNPVGNSAGKLIDEVGLKGCTAGGAEISEMHANFFVNRNNAKASDILKLIELAKAKVFENKGIVLESEIIVIGED